MTILNDPGLRSFLPLSPAEEQKTPFTYRNGPFMDRCDFRSDRPALLVSSTSWTADEDFSILLSALDAYDQAARSAPTSQPLPKILFLITGKGALKADFEKAVAKKEISWRSVRCRTAWLESGDYPKLLGALANLPAYERLSRVTPSQVQPTSVYPCIPARLGLIFR